jgi:DNA-binding MarR family transcriptional regulator
MSTDERDRLIRRITEYQQRMQQVMTANRFHPLLYSTLTMQQFKVLLILSYTGGSPGQELAGIMGASLATMTGIVDRLVAAGLVDRREDPHDRRIRRVTLTDAGRAHVDEIVVAGREHLQAVLRRLDTDDLRVVEQAMSLLTSAAAQEALASHEAVPNR